MRPVNLYSTTNEYVASVLVADDVDLTGIVVWKARYYRFETPDRAKDVCVIEAKEASHTANANTS